jgi:hypothetical protein
MSRHSTVETGDDGVTIRRARTSDSAALDQLAALDAATPLIGAVIVAEVSGEIWAARSLSDGRLISDPFRPAAATRALLELHAVHVGRAIEASRFGRLPAFGGRVSSLVH